MFEQSIAWQRRKLREMACSKMPRAELLRLRKEMAARTWQVIREYWRWVANPSVNAAVEGIYLGRKLADKSAGRKMRSFHP